MGWHGCLAGGIGGGRHLGGTTWEGEGGGCNDAESMRQGTMWAGEVAGDGGRLEGGDFKEGCRSREQAAWDMGRLGSSQQGMGSAGTGPLGGRHQH